MESIDGQPSKFSQMETDFAIDMLRRRQAHVQGSIPQIEAEFVKPASDAEAMGKFFPEFNDTIPEEKINILQEAQNVIYGDREKTYGRPDKNLAVIASLWASYLGIPVGTDDVCILMILLKAARLKNDPTHRDSQVDMCGYAALMERVQDYERSSNSNQNAGQKPA